MRTRIAVLESENVYIKRQLETIVNNTQEIRDIIIGVNLPELQKRVTDLEKNRWIGHGVAGTIGGGAGLGIAKFLTYIGVFAK